MRCQLACCAQLSTQWGRRWLLVTDTAVIYVNTDTGNYNAAFLEPGEMTLFSEWYNTPMRCLLSSVQKYIKWKDSPLEYLNRTFKSHAFLGKIKEVFLFDGDTSVGLGFREAGTRKGFILTNSSRTLVIKCFRVDIL